MYFDNFCTLFYCHSILAEKQLTKQKNYSSLSLSGPLDTHQTFQVGIIAKLPENPEFSKLSPLMFTLVRGALAQRARFLLAHPEVIVAASPRQRPRTDKNKGTQKQHWVRIERSLTVVTNYTYCSYFQRDIVYKFQQICLPTTFANPLQSFLE